MTGLRDAGAAGLYEDGSVVTGPSALIGFRAAIVNVVFIEPARPCVGILLRSDVFVTCEARALRAAAAVRTGTADDGVGDPRSTKSCADVCFLGVRLGEVAAISSTMSCTDRRLVGLRGGLSPVAETLNKCGPEKFEDEGLLRCGFFATSSRKAADPPADGRLGLARNVDLVG